MTEATDDFPALTEEAKALSAVLRDLESRAGRFGTAMTGALTSAAASGKGLDEILKATASRLIDIALSAGLKPLQTTLSAGIGTVVGSLAGGVGALSGANTAAPFSAGGGIAMPTFLAGRLSAAGTGSGPAAGDSGLGATAKAASGGAAVPNVTFNVTARDAESFRRSEGQIAAMLTRTVGRGRRGV